VGLALGAKAQSPFVFFVLLLLMVWGRLRLVVTIFFRVVLILRYRGCGVWILAAFWGTLFQLDVSPFNWINNVVEEVGEKARRKLNKEAFRGKNAREAGEETTIERLQEKYPWWMPSSHAANRTIREEGGHRAAAQGQEHHSRRGMYNQRRKYNQ
jgi:hypothetical protein